MVEYVANKWELDVNTLQHTVSWPSIAKAHKQGSFPFQKFISKWISEDTATGIVLKLRKKRVHDNCPRCNAPHEHLVHILTCPHPEVRTITADLLVELEAWLTQEDTYPSLTPILVASIRSWLLDPYEDEPNFLWPSPHLRKAIIAQQQLGWYAFLMGFIATPIVSLQNSYYKKIDSKKKGTTWATRLIMKCWNLVYHLWTHCNSVLHETQALDALSGVNTLRNWIIAEYALGQGSLHRVYSRYFSVRLETLLQKHTDQLKQWFLVIRSGREAIHVSTTDPFTTNASLRNWIGLPPIYK